MPSRRAAEHKRHGVRDVRSSVVAVATSLVAAVAIAGVQAQNNAPRIDFEALGGSLEVAGNFAGLELWDASSSYAARAARTAGGASLVALDANGQARRVGQTDGSIYAIQQCGTAGQVFYAGNFTSSGSTSTRNIGVYYPQNDTIAPVSDGLDGPVRALACDDATQTLYVGGSFNRPTGAGSSYQGAVATWSTSANQWAAVPFGGFPGSDVDIRSIAISAQDDGKSVIFGGSFDTYWVNGTAASSNVTVTTLANGTVAISSSNLTTASSDGQTVNVFPSYGSSLIPISLASAETSSSASSSNSRYSDPRSILCPAGNDGEVDSTWLAQDGTTGRITARLFAPLDVGGFRIGNTNVEGRGTESFNITAIPTNEVLTLAYRHDPTFTSSAISTCSDACPLSHDASIAYEDFLISPTSGNSTVTLTGFQITLNSHFGASAGLHLFQLLSAGSISYSIDGQNRGYGQGVCSSGPYAVYGRSSSTHAPTSAIPWDHTEVASSTVAGTSEGILCAATPVDTNPADAPEATWYPYIAQDGTYEIQYFTPACAFDSTCGQRGFVDVTVEISGTQGTTSTVTTINQEVTFDTNTLIYSGSIQPISEQQQVKVTMQLSSRQKATLAPGRGDKYYLIADKIIVLAQNTDGNGSTQVKIGTGANAVNVTSADTSRMISYTRGYSLWEWVEGSASTSPPTLDVASTAPQQAQNIDNASGLDRLSFALGSSAIISDVITSSDGAFTFVAGDFNYTSNGMTARSVLAVASGTAGLVSAPQGGLDGPVSSIAVLDGWLYAGGAFNASANGVVTGLNGKARCQYASLASRWEAVSGLDTTAISSTIAIGGENVLFGYTGHALDTWSPANNSVITLSRSFVAGTLTAMSSAASSDGSIYVAGQISTLATSRSNGFGSLNTKGIQPSSIIFDTEATAQQASSVNAIRVKRRALHKEATSEVLTSALDLLKSRLRKRQSSPVVSIPSALPSTTGADTASPEVSAGAYWQNSSSKEQATILGGRFVTSDGIANLAVLNGQGQLTALGEQALTGTISSLAVTGSTLWVGGDYFIASQRMQLASYDLQSGSWQPSVALAADSAQPSVTAITARGDNIVIAGHFSSVAEQPCRSVCEWNGESKAWVAYGAGLTGIVSSVSILKTRLFAAGSFVSNNTSVYVATWDYDSSSWDYLDSASLPGPALSITADSESSIFASGVLAADTGTSYLWHFNGATWADVSAASVTSDTASLNAQGSNIQQIALVPLASEQPGNSLFASGDRALMVSGQLELNSFGDASSALFDGSNWYPYLLASTLSGQPGSINSLFYPASSIAFGRSHHLAIGLVILISMAIALGVVFLGVLIALIIVLSTRHDDPQAYPVVVPPYDNGEWAKREATSPTPFLAGEKGHSKLETLGVATAAMAAGHPVAAAAVATDRERHTSGSTGEAATSSDDGSIYADMEEGDDSLPLRGVRYSFDAEREEELSIRTNDMVEVVDDTDEHWHIVRRLRDGRQGLVPSAFLT